MPNALSRIFFSYSRSDSNFVLKVARALRSAGRNVWVDQLDIPKGARWDEEVEKALKASRCLLVVLSPASTNSQNVLDEVSYALEEGRQVLPILLQPTNIPFRLKRLQYIDFTGDFDIAYKQLVAALDNTPVTASMIQPVPARLVTATAPATDAPAAAAPIAAPTPPVQRPSPGADAADPRPRSLAAIVMMMSLLLLLLLGGAYWLYIYVTTERPLHGTAGPRPRVVVNQPIAADSGTPSTPPVELRQQRPAAPPAPAPAAPTLSNQQVSAFIDDYISAQNQASAAALLDFYAERIDYFGHAGVDKEFILKDKRSFYRRWPQAANRRIGEIDIDRLPDEPAARVSYLIGYRVHSPERSDSRSGQAREYMMLRLEDGRLRIVAQRQDIVQPGTSSKP